MSSERDQNAENQGISNRESAGEEAREREEFPPIQEGRPLPEDASGHPSPDSPDAVRDGHTSHKAGSHSIAEKESNTRYPDRSMPPTHKVAGAFGREPSPERQDPNRKNADRENDET